MEVKDIIKQRRLELGYSMKELGKRVGVSEATISRWESGDISNMKRDKIKALAQALRISPNSIMGWDEVSKTGHDKEYYDPETLEMAQAFYVQMATFLCHHVTFSADKKPPKTA